MATLTKADLKVGHYYKVLLETPSNSVVIIKVVEVYDKTVWNYFGKTKEITCVEYRNCDYANTWNTESIKILQVIRETTEKQFDLRFSSEDSQDPFVNI